MFGTYRWLLAHMVVLGHLWRSLTIWAGPYAVFSFFLLSGYLMALVLDRTYGFSPRGLARYLGNRALRIFPPYWAILVPASLLIAWLPDVARSISMMRLPWDLVHWMWNVVIVGIHLERTRSAIVPPVWSVDIELWFYAGMGLLLARSRAIVWTWFALSLAYTAHSVSQDAPFNTRYAQLAAASLPYSTGALLYFHRERLWRLLTARWHVPLAILVYLANAALGRWLWNVFVEGFYASLLATAYVVAACSALRESDAPGWWVRADRVLGNLSYPVFLAHWSVALVVIAAGLAEGQGPALFFWSLPLVNLYALAVHRGVERPIEHWRNRVRGRAADAS